MVGLTSVQTPRSASLRIQLARLVTKNGRTSSPDLLYKELDPLTHRGEYSDPHRSFVVVESSLAPSDEPDMDAIRASLDAIELLSNADRFQPDGGLW